MNCLTVLFNVAVVVDELFGFERKVSYHNQIPKEPIDLKTRSAQLQSKQEKCGWFVLSQLCQYI